MARPSGVVKGLLGPNRLQISASKLQLLAPGTFQIVTPAYAPSGIRLQGARARADNVRLQFGGVLDELPVQEQSILVGGTTLAIAFDVNNDNATDSFFLSDFELRFSSITVVGLVVDNAVIRLKDLSNHPTLLENQGLAAGSWLGSILLTGETVGLAVVPELQISSRFEGEGAFSATYNIATGDLTAQLPGASYKTPQLAVELFDSELRLNNATRDIGLTGKGRLKLPSLGLSNLEGSLELQVADAALQRVQASVMATQSFGSLGLAGMLAFDHNVSTGSGLVTLTNGQLLDFRGVEGSLRYGNTAISGSLSWRPSVPQNLSLGGLSLQLLRGTIRLDYNLADQVQGGVLHLDDVAVQVVLGGAAATFAGDITLNLSSTGISSLQSASLSLSSDLDVNLDGFNLKLVANDPLAPTKLSFAVNGGTLVPSLSGRIAFTDLAGLALEVPEGGLSFGPQGWNFGDVQISLSRNIDLGSLRIGDRASARFQNGILTVDPDLSVNLDAFSVALRPMASLIGSTVVPIISPIVRLYKTDIDLNSIAAVRGGLEKIRDLVGVDLPATWAALVAYLEDVPGNSFRDNKLTAGELLDFVNYKAFSFVQRNPEVAGQLFKQVFQSDLPPWLLSLPKGVDYDTISMSVAIAKLEGISQVVEALAAPPSSMGSWLPLPVVFQLVENNDQPSLDGGPSARATLEMQLRKLAQDLHRFDQLGGGDSGSAIGEILLSPLAFDYDFQVPLFDNPLETLLAMLGKQPFDIVQSDFNLSSGVALSYTLPLAGLSAAVPPLAAVFSALDARLDLKAGFGAAMALSLGLSSTISVFERLAQGVADGSISRDALTTSFAGFDPITGQPIGLYLAETPGKDLLRLSPSTSLGLGMGRFGVAASAYGQVDGVIDVSLSAAGSPKRLYFADPLSGLADLPGLKAQASIFGEVGLKLDSFFGSSNPNFRFPVVEALDLFSA